MATPLLLVRAGVGLAALGAERAAEVSSRAVGRIIALPSLPVRIAGGAVQTYLHLGQSVTSLAQRGDRVLAVLLPPRVEEQPAWVQFDEDGPVDTPTPTDPPDDGDGDVVRPRGGVDRTSVARARRRR